EHSGNQRSDSSVMGPLLLFAILGLANGQLHGPGNEVNCYECHGPHGHFPDCLNHNRKCHGEEVCQVNYGGAHPEIRCRKREECQRDVDHAHRQCSGGGAEVHGTCQICCTDDMCVGNAVQTLQGSQVGLDLHCPADCSLENLADCITRGHRCLSGQFCQVSIDKHNGHLHGHCENNDKMQHCEEELAKGHCDRESCLAGCCTDDACVAGTLGGLNHHTHTAATAITFTTLSCGLCSLFNHTDCKDTVPDNGCVGLQATDDVCNKNVAIDICPVTCNMCDRWIDMKINEALANGQITGVTGPTMSPTAAPSFNCLDLNGYSCSVLDALCTTVDCPDQCNRCISLDHHCPADCALDDLTMCITRGHRCISGQDQLEGDQCRTLDESKHLCDDTLALRVCPKSCGLCSLFNHTDCQDTVPDNGCVGLQATDDVCNKDVAIDICPVTCNMCSQWIDMKVKEALANGNITGVTGPTVPPDVTTDIPMDTTTMAATTGAPSGLTCDDIQGMDCSVLDALCPLMNCPDACAPCLATTTELPTTTVIPMDTTTMSVGSTGAPSGLTCDDIRGMDCSVLSAICPLMDCPDVCAPCMDQSVCDVTDIVQIIHQGALLGSVCCYATLMSIRRRTKINVKIAFLTLAQGLSEQQSFLVSSRGVNSSSTTNGVHILSTWSDSIAP
ncbi:hypothetical protein BaRGS_00034936, partial [Batillaria attramentaria]